MSSSTSLLDLLIQSQASKEITANNLFNAGSPAALFARRESLCSALNWYYYGGYMFAVSYTHLQASWPFDVVQRGYKIVFVPRGQNSVAPILYADLDARSDSTEAKPLITAPRDVYKRQVE